MLVVHINVKLSGGGAATIARSLHDHCINNDIDSYFVYGYGKNCQIDRDHQNVKNALCISSGFVPVANYFLFKLFGYDVIGPYLTNEIIKIISRADVLHLHVVHSYFISLDKLRKIFELTKNSCKIIWTLHDRWPFTGRCALVGDCGQWLIESGCHRCENGLNYPQTNKLNVSKIYREKINFISKYEERIKFVSPSRHLFKNFNKFGIEYIPNEISVPDTNVDFHDAFEKNSSYSVLVIANDLCDEGKTNRNLVESVSRIDGVVVNCVGKNSPFSSGSIKNLGYFNNKKDLWSIYKSADALLFTSVIDNYPTVLMEAASMGLELFAIASDGAKEVLDRINVKCFETEGLIVEAIKLRVSNNIKRGSSDRKLRAQFARAKFAGGDFFNKYINLYSS